MAQYLVTWTIDIDADSPADAAAEAQRIQRDSESTATYFQVRRHDPPRRSWGVDLDPSGEVVVHRLAAAAPRG